MLYETFYFSYPSYKNFFMTEIRKLKSEIKKLKESNKLISRKLQIAETWMQKEIKSCVIRINKRSKKRFFLDSDDFWDNLEDSITQKIREYFWDYILMVLDNSIIDNIISAEISYNLLKQSPKYDGFWIISSYHKALDSIIEKFITKGYRKFAKKIWQVELKNNDVLEKSLHLVVNKWYILSVWRLFHIIKTIKQKEKSHNYLNTFVSYLDKYSFLKDTLLDDDFLILFSQAIETQCFWKKRHFWKMSFEETKKARKLLIWDLGDKNSLIYLFLKNQGADF